ncbi:MAG: carbon storage regulator [Gammaproteobacteria bacterium]|nr:carbon storage regulator [Gammaproteobacteria bacterium]MBU2067463.1 carbon storage regulator [Gammaproteobacteria bacterium]MBU2139473.1 carbon storage regulator [Gammaproteobacteria bacterium]MBU2255900.1 carbon storage regulator [Gammaproteobacteria bacterium]MBU2294004.1 carbon storage regulator [Gammaproteobacteria bacterium]
MGLILARRIDQEFVLFAAAGANPAQLAEQLKEGIRIRVHDIENGKAYVDISAPQDITILRSELIRSA